MFNFVRGLSSLIGTLCAILATVGLYYGRKEFNKNNGDDLGLDLIVGKVFIAFLWVAVALGYLDHIVAIFTPGFMNRRVRRDNPQVIMV